MEEFRFFSVIELCIISNVFLGVVSAECSFVMM